MSEYRIYGLKGLPLPAEWKNEIQDKYPGVVFEDRLLIKFHTTVEAPTLGGETGAFQIAYDTYIDNEDEHVGWFGGRILLSRAEGWYSADVIRAVNAALANGAHGGPFTPAEQSNPDIILTSVPANSSNEIINAARRRRHRLRRLLLARTFCQANPSLSFADPTRGHSGLTRLSLKNTAINIGFQSAPYRVRLSHSLFDDEYIEATDTHRLATLIGAVQNNHVVPEDGHVHNAPFSGLGNIPDEDMPF